MGTEKFITLFSLLLYLFEIFHNKKFFKELLPLRLNITFFLYYK